MTSADGCYSCDQSARIEALPPRERIAADSQWRTAHAFGVPVPGWLVLVPHRHVTAVADLTSAEAATLGGWQVRLSRALRAVLACQKTYVAQFAEAEGFQHVHFHIVPRMVDLAEQLRGPAIFTTSGGTGQVSVPETEMDELALALRRHLQ